MSSLWISLNLIYAASFLQSSASSFTVSNPGVSLKCNQTVEAVAGESVTLNCTLNYLERDCIGHHYSWSNMCSEQLCNSGSKEYRCEWDKLTYASLIISNISKEENYRVQVHTNCGYIESSVTIRVKTQSNSLNGVGRFILLREEQQWNSPNRMESSMPGFKSNSPMTAAMHVPTSTLVAYLVFIVWD